MARPAWLSRDVKLTTSVVGLPGLQWVKEGKLAELPSPYPFLPYNMWLLLRT